jgi:hypothetical protein
MVNESAQAAGAPVHELRHYAGDRAQGGNAGASDRLCK